MKGDEPFTHEVLASEVLYSLLSILEGSFNRVRKRGKTNI